jgi:hypothetical protein
MTATTPSTALATVPASSPTAWTPTASRSRAVVAQARAYPAPAVPAVRRRGHRLGHPPGHQGRPHAEDRQRRVNPREGDRVHRMISALVTAGIDAGYLVNSRLAKVHWQAGDRPLPAPAVSVAGESAQWVDPAEIPSDDDVSNLGVALGGRDELMASTAAYSGLRWAELIDQDARVSSLSTARWSKLPGTARRSTRGTRRPAIRLRNRSPPGSRRPAPSRRPELTLSG